MSEDREMVKQAIKWARVEDHVLTAEWVQPRPPSAYAILADAAEKWLATQPEPNWKVRIWWHETEMFKSWAFDSEETARNEAASALRNGARKVEIEKP